MGRNRRTKNRKAPAPAIVPGDGGENRLEEPLLASEHDVESKAETPSLSASRNQPRSPVAQSPVQSPRETPSSTPSKTPPSSLSIPKPRVSPNLKSESADDEAPEPCFLTEPLLPRRVEPDEIPKPRVVASLNRTEQAPESPEPLTEPLLPREVSVTFRDEDELHLRREGGHGDGGNGSDGDAIHVTENTPFSRRKELGAIWSLGWPMGISYFCRMAMASTDSIMVGHFSGGDNSPGEYLAASALSDMLTTLMVVPPLAFNQVLNALVGQAVGSREPKMAGVWLQQSVFWLGLTMAPCLVGFFFVEKALLLLGFSATISRLAGQYAKYNVFWPVPNGWYQCMRFYFQAVGKPRPAMWNGVAFLFINALLNWVFVFGGPFRFAKRFGNWRGLGFIGAAVSLSLSRCLQPLVYWVYMFQLKKAHVGFWPDTGGVRGLKSYVRKHHPSAVTCEFLKQGVPLVGTLVFSATVSQATTLLVSKLGTDAVAATTAVSTATVMWAGAINAMFSMVIAVRVGYHLGRGDGDAARRSFWLATGVVFLTLVTVIALTLPFTHQVVGLTTSDKVVVTNASRVLPAAVVATLLGVLNSLCTGGVFSGQGRQRLVAGLSFFVDIPLSIGGVAAVVLLIKNATLLNVYEYQMAAACVELTIAYAFIVKSDWGKYAREARERQTRR